MRTVVVAYVVKKYAFGWKNLEKKKKNVWLLFYTTDVSRDVEIKYRSRVLYIIVTHNRTYVYYAVEQSVCRYYSADKKKKTYIIIVKVGRSHVRGDVRGPNCDLCPVNDESSSRRITIKLFRIDWRRFG